LTGKLTFTKNRSYGQRDHRSDIPYEVVRRIAEMRLVDKMTPADITRSLNVPYSVVIGIIEARKQNSDWVDAIADLGRKGLIE